MPNLNALSLVPFLLAGALAGLSLAACDLGPKMIGEECQQGDQKPADDGCNTCTCADGQWACTEMACADSDSMSGGVTGDAPACEDGEQMPAGDGCNTCTCLEGQWACTQIGCDDTDGVPPECEDGEVMVDECGQPCSCEEGAWLCAKGPCVDTDSAGTETEGGTDTDSAGTETEGGTDTDGGGLVCADQPHDPLTIVGAAIAGDALLLDVEYGGGCEDHLIDICWDGVFAESFPVQAWVDVVHESNDDPCDAVVMEQREIDLTAMKTAWQEGYQQEHGTIVLHVAGWGTSLDYNF
jgi:hypothetical protein